MAEEQATAEVADARPISVRKLEERFGDGILSATEYRDEWTVVAAKSVIHQVMAFLKDDPDIAYSHLSDLTAVDYLNMEDVRLRYDQARFMVVYHLYSHKNVKDPELRRLRVKTPVHERDLRVPTLSDLWTGANWLEREVYDMFGIRFDGHPDLRRILMPDSFEHHPLRKDYPLKGRGERESFDFEDEKPGRPAH